MIVFIIILIALILIFLGIEYYVYYAVFYSPHKSQRIEARLPHSLVDDDDQRIRCKKDIAYIQNLPFEFVSVTSYDGLKLVARVFRSEKNAPVCICFHGYRGAAIRDFSGVGSYLVDRGYNVILVDERAHFRSGGHSISYGIRERRDVKTWCDFALKEFGDDAELRLYGISMGAATVLLASSLDLPANVCSISADCPYDSPANIIRKVCAEDRNLPVKLMYPMIVVAGLIFGRFNITGISAVEEVKKAKVPILIMHGEADRLVPGEMSKRIFEANPELIERHTFPGAGHGLSYLKDRERYLRIHDDFFSRTSRRPFGKERTDCES